MADKKKNYAEALKAQMPSKPADPSKEMIEVDMDGVVTPIVRGNMTDEQWANAKKRAVVVVKPTSVSYETGGEPTPAEIEAGRSPDVKAGMERADKADAADTRRRALQQLFENPHYQVGAGSLIPDEDTRDLLKKMPVEKAVDYLEKRLQHQEWKQKQDLENSKKLSDETQPADKTVNPSKPSQGAPSEWDQPKPKTTGGVGTQTENDGPYVSDAGPGMSVRGNMAQMALGASPKFLPGLVEGQTKGTTPGEQAATEQYRQEYKNSGLDPAITDAVGGAISTVGDAAKALVTPMVQMPTPEEIQNAPSLRAPMPSPEDIEASKNSTLGRFAGALVDEAGNAIAHPLDFVKNVGKGIGNFGAGMGMGQAPVPTTPGTPAGMPGGTPVPVIPGIDPAGQPSGSMGGSMSMSGRVPGTGAGIKTPSYDAEMKARHEGLTTQLMQEAAIADKQSELLTKKAGLIAQKQDAEVLLAARQAAMDTARSERMKQGQAGLATLQSRLADLESQAPDPNRYWNNKDAGQKAAAIISGALFGYAGQGMQWLQRLDGLVENDIQQQAAELQRKSGLVGKQLDVQNNLVALARQQGLDENEAISAARMMMHNKYAMQFEAAAATTGSETVKMQALQNAGILRQKAAEEDMNLKMKTNEAAQKAALNAAQINHLNAQTFAARVAAAGGGGKGGGDKKLAPGTREEISKLEKSLEAIKQAREALKGGNKFTDQIANNVRDALSAVGQSTTGEWLTPDTTGRTAVAEAAQETALKGVMGEALQEKDIERNKPRFARPGLNAGNTAWLDSQEEVLKTKLNALINAKDEGDITPRASGKLNTERPAQ